MVREPHHERAGDPLPNTVTFYDTAGYEQNCGPVKRSPACTIVNEKAILLHANEDWKSKSETKHCPRIHATLQHEVLHLYGLDHGRLHEALSQHWVGRRKDLCALTPYDVVAVMAIYQSR